MKFLHTLLLTAAIATMTSCGTATIANKGTTKAADPTFTARRALTAEQQRTFDKLYLEAICQKLKGNNDAAFEMLQAALDINPQAAEALFEMSQLLLSTAPHSALMTPEDSTFTLHGEEMLKKAYELEPSNPYYRSALADHFIRGGEYEEAARLYEIMQAEKPSTQNLMILSRLYMATMQPVAALEILNKLEEQEGLDEEIAMEEYNMLNAIGKPDEAIKVVERLCEENPQELRYQVILAYSYIEMDQQEKAVEIFNQVLAIDPNFTLAKTGLLTTYLQSGDTERFDAELSSIMLNPDVSNTQKRDILQTYAVEVTRGNPTINKERLYDHFCEALSLPQDDGDIAELCIAYAEFAKINPLPKGPKPFIVLLETDPANIMARYKMLQYYIANEDTPSLLDLCIEGTKHHPEDPIFYYYAGASYYQNDRIDEGIDILEKGTKVLEESNEEEVVAEIASDIFATLGDLYHRKGQNEKAYEAYDKAIDYNPDNVLCLNNFAYYLSVEGKQLDKALKMSKKTIDSEPNNPTYLDTYAWILFRKGQYTEARIYIDQTLKSLPDSEREESVSASLYDHAGDIYFRLGDTTKALEHWQHAASLSTDSDLTKKLNIKIKNKRL